MCDIATVLDPASATELLSMYPVEDFENKNPMRKTVVSASTASLTNKAEPTVSYYPL